MSCSHKQRDLAASLDGFVAHQISWRAASHAGEVSAAALVGRASRNLGGRPKRYRAAHKHRSRLVLSYLTSGLNLLASICTASNSGPAQKPKTGPSCPHAHDALASDYYMHHTCCITPTLSMATVRQVGRSRLQSTWQVEPAVFAQRTHRSRPALAYWTSGLYLLASMCTASNSGPAQKHQTHLVHTHMASVLLTTACHRMVHLLR